MLFYTYTLNGKILHIGKIYRQKSMAQVRFMLYLVHLIALKMSARFNVFKTTWVRNDEK